jgi:hypothetical protein
MNETKGLLVVPKEGNSYPALNLRQAEILARYYADLGRGPVEIVSRFTGDVLGVFGEELE